MWTEQYAPYLFNGDPGGRLDTTTLPNGAHVLKVVAAATKEARPRRRRVSRSRTCRRRLPRQARRLPRQPRLFRHRPRLLPRRPFPHPRRPPAVPGRSRVMLATSSSTDPYTNNPSLAQQQWMRDHWTRALVYSTYWDSRTTWFPNAWAYLDAYAIYQAVDARDAASRLDPQGRRPETSSTSRGAAPAACVRSTRPTSATRPSALPDRRRALHAGPGYKGLYSTM